MWEGPCNLHVPTRHTSEVGQSGVYVMAERELWSSVHMCACEFSERFRRNQVNGSLLLDFIDDGEMFESVGITRQRDQGVLKDLISGRVSAVDAIMEAD